MVRASASSDGVRPRWFFATGSAPAATRSSKTSVLPYPAARCRGVSPSRFFALSSLPAAMVALKMIEATPDKEGEIWYSMTKDGDKVDVSDLSRGVE